MTDVVSVENLVIRYPARGLFTARPAPALRGVSLTVGSGETLGLVGESGSGKSSLLRAILGLIPAESGAIRILGQDWSQLDGAALRRARQAVGVVAQNPFLSLSPRLSVAEILAEPLLARGDAMTPRCMTAVRHCWPAAACPATSCPAAPARYPAVRPSAWRSPGRWRWSRS